MKRDVPFLATFDRFQQPNQFSYKQKKTGYRDTKFKPPVSIATVVSIHSVDRHNCLVAMVTST